MGSNTEKKPWTNLQNSYKNLRKEIKSDNFCYRKVGRVITKWEAIEKSPILLSDYWKNFHFQRVTIIISHFDGSNNIFADCMFNKIIDSNSLCSFLQLGLSFALYALGVKHMFSFLTSSVSHLWRYFFYCSTYHIKVNKKKVCT